MIIGVIPARFNSSRFPGKPLALIQGKTLLQRVFENAKRCHALDDLFIATDDQRIFSHVTDFGGKPVMTSSTCRTGTDRLAEAVEKMPELEQASIIVNIQGDEPCLEPSVIEQIIAPLQQDPELVMSTAVCPIGTHEEVQSPSVVKCVTDQKGFALYFSRNAIPAWKNKDDADLSIYRKHIGLYAYRKHFLTRFRKLKETALQQAEDLEQLKVLEHGYRIKTVFVQSAAVGVDTPEDIQKVEALL